MVKRLENNFDSKIDQDTKWAKIFIIILAVLLPIIFSASMMYGILATHGTSPLVAELTQHTIREVDSLGDSNSNIIAIQVVKIDLTTNTRTLVYMYLKEAYLKNIYNSWLSTRLSPDYPVFTRDTPDNKRLVRLINHEFVCSPYSETLTYRLYPETGKYVSTMCAMSIPPSYGKFVGVIGVMLRNPITDSEKSVLDASLKRLTTDAYTDLSH
jgi:hypothetical protein